MRRYFPIAAFVAVALASLAMAAFAYFAADEATRFKFEATSDDALKRIESSVDLHVSLLRGADAFFTASGDQADGKEFAAYFDALQPGKNLEGLRGLGLLGMGRPGEEARLEREIEDRFGARKEIVPPKAEGEWRMPVVLVQPLDQVRKKAVGFDMFSDPERRDALLAAIETGQPRATGLIMLGQQISGDASPGFLLFSSVNPVVDGSESPASGIVFAAFRTQELFRAALDRFPALPLHVEVFDGATQPAALLFSSANEPSEDIDISSTRQLLVAGRPWTVVFRPTAEFTPPTSGAIPVVLGLIGLLLALAIALLQRYQSRAYEAMATLQENAEKSLLEKDLMLQEMKHRIKNSITRMLAIARQTAASSQDIAEFSESFAARLRAMAASQDMLTRSRWQKADLAELLGVELAQAFGKELPDGMISGPPVLLSEVMTQALGLTFHELATNALKYGEVGNSPDALRVQWRLKENGRLLSLSWRETGGQAVAPPEKPGFGTRLIDLNVTRELKGTIRRDYRSDGLHIEIEVPMTGGRSIQA